ncbi:MAG TPA: peptidoglycan-binding domain-containing protein [Luteimonas sp.]|nr:peptidoglycan-binding domain-containing protein [Luteimonas sp.]
MAGADMHRVGDDEHVPGIAAAHGHRNYLHVWAHPGNAALRQLRTRPSILCGGDTLYVPPVAPDSVDKPTDQRHRFTIQRAPLALRVAVYRRFGATLQGCPARLVLEPTLRALPLDADGGIEAGIEPGGTTAALHLDPPAPATAAGVETLPRAFGLHIGRLDPVDTPSGQMQRLRNLGYFQHPAHDPRADDLRSAVEEFQCDQALAVDGVPGPTTRAALERAHGC